ncbi:MULTISPECIES: hypothetical protein [unclassified Massilia]|uniref:hypothetical protein n=1 Tax=unclassified Massilia TaxID=2609279 RepID=UPI001B845F1B|nr:MULTISPECIES: hypothetical protein [unclassified Massilia]MBQ5939814.1 hypothetical protein [Massilia sp. AB1]MBQ5963094.1 hypothetical protein [Massilia sp. ZL223]
MEKHGHTPFSAQHGRYIPIVNKFPLGYARGAHFIGEAAPITLMRSKKRPNCMNYVRPVLQEEEGESGAEQTGVVSILLSERQWMTSKSAILLSGRKDGLRGRAERMNILSSKRKMAQNLF